MQLAWRLFSVTGSSIHVERSSTELGGDLPAPDGYIDPNVFIVHGHTLGPLFFRLVWRMSQLTPNPAGSISSSLHAY